MAIDWKKVSEHPLPNMRQDNKIITKHKDGRLIVCNFLGSVDKLDVTHWAEITPPDPDKEPEIALWSVWESNTAKKLKIVFNTDDGRVLIYDPILATRNNFDRTGFLKFHKPRPDLEVLAPRLKKSVLTGEVYFDTTYYPKLIKKDGGTYKWPAELGQMIVVPKEGV